MQTKISLKWSLFIVSAVGIACFSIIAFVFIRQFIEEMAFPERPPISKSLLTVAPTFVQSATTSEKSAQTGWSVSKAEPGFPVRLKIPKIKVDAVVESVGLTSEGDMDASKSPNNAAWFQLGPRPGQKGSSVINGHFGWKDGISAVFDDLSELRKGDKLYVEDEKGVTFVFVVRELRTYALNDDVSDVFDLNGNSARLNLITCEGVWNKTEKSYSKRLVVFSDME